MMCRVMGAKSALSDWCEDRLAELQRLWLNLVCLQKMRQLLGTEIGKDFVADY